MKNPGFSQTPKGNHPPHIPHRLSGSPEENHPEQLSSGSVLALHWINYSVGP
jgi:hypothetical protein